MKKVLFIVACLTLALGFTGCKKIKLADVEISVVDKNGTPLPGRIVIYTDAVSTLIDVLVPDPAAPLKDESDLAAETQYVKTGADGYVTLKDAIVDVEYAFYTYDDLSNQWVEETRKITEGKNSVQLKVN